MKAEQESTTTVPRTGNPAIRVSESDLDFGYIGSREDLIAAGLAMPSQFPGEPGCGKTSTVFPAEGERRKMRVAVRTIKAGRPVEFRISLYKTKEERVAYCKQRQAEHEEAQRAQRTARDREILTDFGGPRGMAETYLHGGVISIIQAFNITNEPVHPYTFDKATTDKVTLLCQQIVGLFKSGVFTPRLGAIVQADAEFQRFMTRAACSGLSSS